MRNAAGGPLGLAIMLTAWGGLAACSGDDPAGDDLYEGELFPNTRVLEAETLGALRASEEDGTLRFRGSPEQLAGVEEGAVLLAGAHTNAPAGLLRFVHGVESDAGGLVLRTTEAPIQLAYKKLEVRFTREVDAGVARPTFAPVGTRTGAVSQSLSGEFWPSLDVDEFVFNGDGDPNTPLDQVRVRGLLSGGVRYTFSLSVDWGAVSDLPDAVTDCLKKFLKLSFNCSPQDLMPEAKIGFAVEMGADASLGMEGVAFLGYGDEIIVAEADLPPVQLGPLWFYPRIEVRTEFEGEASSQFALSAKAAVGLETGISFSNKSGGQFTGPTLTHSVSAPTVEATLSAGVRLRIGPRLIVTLHQVAGIYASLYAVGELSADQSRTPCYLLEGGVEGDAGFLIKSPDLPLLGSVTIAKFEKDFDVVKTVIDSGPCKIPTVPGPPPVGGQPAVEAYTNPSFTPWGRAYPALVDGFPHEGPGAQVEWAALTPTIDGRFMLSGSDTRVLSKLDADGEVVWAKRYVATHLDRWRDTMIPDLLPGRVVNGTNGMMFVVAHPYTLMKLRADGSLVWAKRFELGDQYRETWMRFTDAVADGAGGLYLIGGLGQDWTNSLSDYDGWILRVNARGDVLWSKRLHLEGRAPVPRRIVRYHDDVAVTGATWNATGARWRGFVARFTPSGQMVWGNELTATDCGPSGEQWIYPQALLATRDGDLVVGGGTLQSGYGFMVAKLKPDGALSWHESTARSEFNHLGPLITDLVELPTSGYLAVGHYISNQSHEDVFLSQLDAIGKPLWARTYGGTQNPNNPLFTDDNYPTLQLTQDGGALIAAYSESLTDEDGMFVFKTAAKDGVMSFGGSTSAETAELSLVAGPTCLIEGPWPVEVSDESVPTVSQPLRVEAVTVPSTGL